MHNMNRKFVNVYELLNCLTNAGDLISPQLANHHQKVAYLALRIAEEIELPINEQQDLVLAGLLHDVGAVSLAERLEILENEPPSVNDHAFNGAKMIEGFTHLQHVANIIRYHHVPWNHGEGQHFDGQPISYLSHILYLADRVVVLIDPERDILDQTTLIKDRISEHKHTRFVPELVDAFLSLCQKEYIWLDITHKSIQDIMLNLMVFDTLDLELDDVINLTKIFANIIDSRSPFTANHSIGVAKTSQKLAELIGFSRNECKMMLIAGYLHDLGKLAIDNSILEKPEKLTPKEYNIVKSHPYHTYRLLQMIHGFEIINTWASLHHEKLNGEGYPFHLKNKSIPLGARIMAVADVFTAITEDRPYRKGMTMKQATTVLRKMVDNQSLCSYVVSTLMDNLDIINETRIQAQRN